MADRFNAQAVNDALEKFLEDELEILDSGKEGHSIAEAHISKRLIERIQRRLSEIQREYPLSNFVTQTKFNTRYLIQHGGTISLSTFTAAMVFGYQPANGAGWTYLDRERQTSESYGGWRLWFARSAPHGKHWDIPDQDVEVDDHGGFIVKTIDDQEFKVNVGWPTVSVYHYMHAAIQNAKAKE